MEQLNFVVTFLAALGTALLAGNFFAFSAFLMTALRGLSAERGIVAMQAITAAIKKPVFLTVFFGTAALCAVLSGSALLRWGAPGSCYLLAGTLFFLMGAFPVTMMRNVPLNNQLAAVTPDSKDGRDLWKRFQSSWGVWNHIRAITSLLACAFLILALVAMGNPFGLRPI
jgi:uncharacterized membrane protein